MRDGAEYFTQPVPSAQRRYEAMRAYFVDDMPAAQVADRFGYSTASVHQMATLLRGGRMEFFAAAKPGPKGPRKAGQVHDRVLALRADGHSVTEIAAALHAEGTPVSAQTVWTILDAEGIARLVRDDTGRRGTPARLDPVKATTLSPSSWPAGTHLPCDHAGLFLLLPAIVSLGLPDLIHAAAYPGRRALTHHIDALTDDTALALALNLTALPKANHLRTYAYRVRRDSNRTLLSGLVNALRRQGLATGEAGFNCDFHAIRHHGEVVPLEKHYVPKRSLRTRAVLTFFAQDHASTEMVYANADITKAEQAREIIAFADYWQQATGSDPGLLVFDSQLTNYTVLNELTQRSLRWLTLRKRGPKVLSELAALPASAWTTHRIDRAGHYRHPQIHEQVLAIKGIDNRVRQIAVRNIGRDEPTLIITNALTTPAKDLFARYAERMTIENELDAYISGFHLDALTSGLPLNVDLDTTLTVVAGNLYRILARTLPRYETATPDKIWRHFLDATGTLNVTNDAITVNLNLPIPWLNNRHLRFGFPPR